MFSLYKLQAKIYFKGADAFFSFFTAFVFLLIFGSIVKYSGADDESLSLGMLIVFGSVTSITIMNVSFNSFGYGLFDMKNSVLIRRIGATKLTKSDVLSSFILWGTTIVIMQILWLFALMLLMGNAINYFPSLELSGISWVGLIYGILIGSVASFGVALFLVSISKSTQIYQVFSTLYFFLFAAFGGLFTPTVSARWMEIIGWFSPLTWTAHIISHAMQGAPVFNLGGYTISPTDSVNAANAVAEVFAPIVFAIVFIGLTTKTFKWDS